MTPINIVDAASPSESATNFTTPTRRHERLTSTSLAIATVLFGVAGAVTLPSWYLSHAGVIVVAAVSATCLPVSAFWLLGRLPRRRAAIAFVIYSDVAVAAVLLSFESSMVALPGCSLFVVIALFCVAATSRRVHIAHLCAAAILTATVSTLALTQGADGWIVSARFVISIALLFSSWFLRFHIASVGDRKPKQLPEEMSAHSDHLGQTAAVTRDRATILELIDLGGPDLVFQPICHADGLGIAGFEALSRFPCELGTPLEWFTRASNAGVGPALELAAIHSAIAIAPRLPAGAFLTLNVSAAAIQEHDLASALAAVADSRPVFLEITEHDLVDDYPALRKSANSLRAQGIQVAIDDVGAGFSTLRHVLELDPSLVKIDRALVHGADTDRRKLAAVTMLTRFGHHLGANVVAEGVETAAEYAAMITADVDYIQGFYISPPRKIS